MLGENYFHMRQEFNFLKPEDIPPRRSSKKGGGKESDDVLTRLIFSSFEPESSLDEPEEDRLSQELFAGAEPEAILADIDYQETLLVSVTGDSLAKAFKDIGFEVEPLPDAALQKTEPEAHKKPDIRLAESVSVSQEDIARANENWFPVELANVKIATLPSVGAPLKRPRTKFFKKLTLVSFLLAAALATTLLVTQTNFFGLNKSKGLLSSSSFTLVNAERETTFPPLFLLHKNISDLSENIFLELDQNPSSKSELITQLEELENINRKIEEFFGDNKKFSWANMFKDQDGFLSSARPSWPVSTELLQEVAAQKEIFEKKYDYTIKPANKDLASYLAWLNFWQNLLSHDSRYLVLTTHPTRLSPVMGELLNYTVVEVTNGTLRVTLEDKVETLNAALSAKIIPPEPIQVFKTSFDFFEAGWFLDFRSFAKIFLSLWQDTTKQEIDGLALVSHNFLKELALKQAFSFEPTSADWLGEVFGALARRSSIIPQSFQKNLASALGDHRLEIFFSNEELARFVELENLALLPSLGVGEDAISFGFRQWEEGELEVELLEYELQFLANEPIVSNLSLFLRNNSLEPLTVYGKIYLPVGSEILEENGFGKSKKPPFFDYQANGFLSLEGFLRLDKKAPDNLDLFLEGNFLVVGGWVSLPPEKRHTITLSYRLPGRLAPDKNDVYTLKIFKTGLASPPSFRFRADWGKDVSFEWREPIGFLNESEGKAEYQTTLWRDTTLRARVTITNP